MKKIVLLILSFLLVGCSLPGLGGSAKNNDVVIAGGSTTERQILAEINLQMIHHYFPKMNVSLINNLGSSLLILQSMTQKDANISGAMYTGTSLTGELAQEPTTDPKEAMKRVVMGYYEKYNLLWLPSYGFENTYAFMVKREFAEENNLNKISDLKELAPKLKAGVDTGWIDRKGDGYEAFKEIYAFDFERVLPMEIGLVYDAVVSNEMDLVLGYSTDGRIQAYDLVILEDDLRLFPPYDASPIISLDLYKKHPEIVDVLLKLEGAIDNSMMQKLNRVSDEEKIEPKVVVKRFLEEKKYFEDTKIQDLSHNPLYLEIIKDVMIDE